MKSQQKIGSYLQDVKTEILSRTRASSEGLTGGDQVDLFMTSIFDRSSSSSEAELETPNSYAEARAPWHHGELPADALIRFEDNIPRRGPLLLAPHVRRSTEDMGYESGNEDERSSKLVPNLNPTRFEHMKTRF